MRIKKILLSLLLGLFVSVSAAGFPLSKGKLSVKYPFSGRAEVKITLINDLKEPLIFQSVYKP